MSRKRREAISRDHHRDKISPDQQPTANPSDISAEEIPTVRGQLPAFHQFDPLKFQQLCCEIHQKEQHISTADVFGTSGQAQYGVDIVAYLKSNQGIEAGQCKRTAKCTPRSIRAASKDFIINLEYWKKREVRKFILYVGCGTSRRQVQEAIAEEKKLFLTFGIEYEAWSNQTLTTKVRAYPEIARVYCGPAWEKELCGEGIGNLPSRESPIVDIAAYRELAHTLAGHLSSDADQELERLREAWREGRSSEIRAAIKRMREPTRWGVLPSSVKAKVFRFQAQLDLEVGDIESAENFTAEAQVLDPGQNRRTEALLYRAHGNLDAALQKLEDAEDLDSLILRAALLLEKSRIHEALLILAQLQGNPEAHRLLALASFLQRDIPKARLEIEKAAALKPRWRAIIHARSILQYFSGLALCAVSQGLPQWPEPIDWAFVKLDNDSRDAFRSARDGFAGLEAGKELTDEERRLYQIWHLACLANDPERRQEAEAYCREILASDPCHHLMLPWILARRLEVDLVTVARLLETRISNGGASVPEIISFCIWHVQNGNHTTAMRVLEQNKPVFARASVLPLWHLWLAQIAPLAGESATASEGVPESELSERELVAFRAHALKTGDHTNLIKALTRQARTNGIRLWELCTIFAEQNQWVEVANLSSDLVHLVGTAQAVNLACIALYNAKQYSQCLELLENHRSLYPNSELPNEMQRLRIATQRELGLLPDAAVRAEQLFNREPTKKNYLMLCDLYFEKGDFKALVLLSRKHILYSDLTSTELLRMSMRVADEDRGIGAEIWRRAANVGIADDQVTAALDVGYKLELDYELRPLLERLSRLADNPDGHIRRFTLPEAIEILKHHIGDSDRLFRAYRDTQVPVHMIAGPMKWPLVVPYHRSPEINKRFPGQAPTALIRHGSRAASKVQLGESSRPRLHADLTALLTAYQMGVLQIVLAVHKPIRLPHPTLVALAAMRDSVRPPQPGRIAALAAVADLVRQNQITLVNAHSENNIVAIEPKIDSHTGHLLAIALSKGWLLATSLPIFDEHGFAITDVLPSNYHSVLRDGHSIAQSLREFGEISEHEHRQAMENMGIRQSVTTNEPIPLQATVLCRSYLLESLASTGILNQAARTFHLAVEANEYHQSVTDQIEAFGTAEKDAMWLTKLIDHLSRGLDDGSYQLMPNIDHKHDALGEAAEENPTLKCFLDLVTFVPAAGDIIWADDRWWSSYVHRDGAIIADTIDILHTLLKQGKVSSSEFYNVLLGMRQCDFQFIALQEDEIKTAIADAPVIDNHLVETQRLRTLRGYYARCLTAAAILRVLPAAEPGQNNTLEWPFILSSGQAVLNALVDIWREAKDLQITPAKSEWLLSNLYSPDRGRAFTKAPARPELPLLMEAAALSTLLARATAFSATEPTERNARRAYFDWIYHRLLYNRFSSDPLLATTTLDGLKRLLETSVESTSDSAAHRRAACAVAGAFFQDLPEELRQKLAEDGNFLEKIGASQRVILTLGTHLIHADRLWEAAAGLVIEGRKVTIKADDGSELEIRIEIANERKRLVLYDVKGNCAYVLLPDAVGVLANSVAERERALRTAIHWFDRSAPECDQAIATIVTIEDPAKRITKLLEFRRQAAESYYADLHTMIVQRLSFHPSDLIPQDVTCILRHLRLSLGSGQPFDLRTSIEKAAELLISEIGIENAIVRLAGLPIALPSSIFRALSTISVDDRTQLIRRLLRFLTRSPLGSTHSARILTVFSTDRRSYHRLACKLVQRLLQSRDYIDLWLATLHRCSDDLGFIQVFRKMSHAERFLILWCHGDRLFRVLRNAGVPEDWIKDNIAAGGPRLSAEIVFPDPDYASDVIYPRRIDATWFSVASTAYVLDQNIQPEDAFATAFSSLIADDQTILAHLIRDRSRAPNVLGSFLGSCYNWPSLLPTSLQEGFSQDALPKMLEEALEQIGTGSANIALWAWIYAVLGEIEPPADLIPLFRKAVLATDFKQLYERTTEHRLVPITVASIQAAHLGPEVAAYTRNQLLALAYYLRDNTSNPDLDQSLILSAAFNVVSALSTENKHFSRIGITGR